MSWYPKFGWMSLRDEEAQQLELNLNFKWEMWRVEWFNAGIAFKIRPTGPRFEEPETQAKRKRKRA